MHPRISNFYQGNRNSFYQTSNNPVQNDNMKLISTKSPHPVPNCHPQMLAFHPSPNQRNHSYPPLHPLNLNASKPSNFKTLQPQNSKNQKPERLKTLKPQDPQTPRPSKPKTLRTSHWLLFLLLLSQTACVKYPQLLYFRNQEEFVQLQNHNITNEVQIKIQPDDALLIMFRALDQETAEPFNLFPSTILNNNANSSSNTTLQGYLVDTNGNIDIPVLGRVKVSDLTIEETKEMLITKLKPFLNDPVVLIRFLNFKCTVLGEVKSPRTINVPGERITILEALGQAGDLTPYSNREKIMVIREQDGKRDFGYINIHSPEVFQSPYFYLQQNDIVYVEPIKEATAIVRDPITESLPILSSILSIGAILVALLR